MVLYPTNPTKSISHPNQPQKGRHRAVATDVSVFICSLDAVSVGLMGGVCALIVTASLGSVCLDCNSFLWRGLLEQPYFHRCVPHHLSLLDFL